MTVLRVNRTGRLRIVSNCKGRDGQALIMVTLGLAFLMGILGLVVDVGWGYYQKQVAQTAADSAAMAATVAAGTGSIACGTGGVLCQSTATACSTITTGTNLSAGCLYGVQNGVPATEIKMASGTTAFSGISTDYWVTATVSIPQSLTFLRVMGFDTATIVASASGAVVGSGSGGGGCVYALDNTTSGAGITLSGAGLYLSCGVYINNASTTNAFSLSGSQASICYGTGTSCTSGKTVPLTMVSGAKISASGSGCKQDSYYGTQNPSNTIQCSDPNYASPVADPLASLPAPTVGACSGGSTLGTATWSHSSTWSWSNLSPPQTINPGVYCGGINIGGGNVTFTPGTYILNGGGLTIQGSNTTVTGSGGVFFYNTSSGYSAGPLNMSGQPNVNFKSPSSGTYQGIFFMQDHSVCSSSSNTIQGNTNIEINGTIYAHCTNPTYSPDTLIYTGESSTGYYTAIVVDKLTVNGMSNLVLDPTGGQNTGIGLSGVSKPYLIQ
jgi:hypothetical protein